MLADDIPTNNVGSVAATAHLVRYFWLPAFYVENQNLWYSGVLFLKYHGFINILCRIMEVTAFAN